jgi:hypothetical protein
MRFFQHLGWEGAWNMRAGGGGSMDHLRRLPTQKWRAVHDELETSDLQNDFPVDAIRAGAAQNAIIDKKKEINMSLQAKNLLAAALVCALACSSAHAADIKPAEARAIAKEAYIYGSPMVDSYRVTYAYFVASGNPEYKGPFNQIRNFARLMTPDDKAVQTPNSDTAYSFLGLDLRAEPVVISVPKVTNNRYFVLQFVDTYTHNFAYVGSTTTGNDGGSFLVAGPHWKGATPKGVKQVIRSETELALVPFRTQVFGPDDIEKVKQVQAGYKSQTLSAFLGQPAPKAVPAINFIKPVSPEQQKTSLEFFNILNFVLQFGPTHPSEKELMARLAKIGVGAGKSFDQNKLTPEMKTAIEQGMADAWQALAEVEAQMDAGKVTSGDLFGTRQHLQNNYLYRMLGAVWGIYGNSREEAIYPTYTVDANGQKLDAGAHRYTVRFAPGQLPPVKAFWSLTMYEMPASYLYPNPLKRYLLNSPMLPQFKKDADGGLTFYVQHESPGVDKEANWLPAPKGPFKIVMRLYGPQPAALEGKWTQPPLQIVK